MIKLAPPSVPRDQRGITLPEMLVVTALLSVIGILFFQLFTGTAKTSMMLESRADLNTLGQRSVNELRNQLMQSRLVLEGDAVGQSYLTAATFDSDTPVLTGTKLPSIDAAGMIEPETSGSNLVGNSILLVRQHDPVGISIDHDADAGTANIDFLADTYTFQYFYLTERDQRDFGSTGSYLDLVKTESATYADYFQLSGLSSAVRSQLHTALIAQGIEWAWDPGESAGSAFYALTSAGGLTGPNSGHKIDLSTPETMLPEFAGGRITGNMTYSVARNNVMVSSGYLPSHKLAYPDGEFPGGFEVLIVGPSGSRRVFIRLALMSEQANQILGHANEIVIASSDF